MPRLVMLGGLGSHGALGPELRVPAPPCTEGSALLGSAWALHTGRLLLRKGPRLPEPMRPPPIWGVCLGLSQEGC